MSQIEFTEVGDVLEYILLLSKTERDYISEIKSESTLSKYFEDSDIEETGDIINYFKIIIPCIKNLQNAINKIDNELNIAEVFRNNNSTYLKQIRNVPDFTRTMRNFYNSNFYIKFKLGIDKLIGIKLVSASDLLGPNLDFPLKENTDLVNFKVFDELKDKFNKEEDCSNIVWKPTQEQAQEIFRGKYSFIPREAKNNGLYILNIEQNAGNFGKAPSKVKIIDCIEPKLAQAGIIKKKRNELNLNIKILSQKFTQFNCALFNQNTELFKFNLSYNFGQFILLYIN